MQHSAAAGLSVIGRNVASAGDFAEISAGSDHYVLRRSGNTLGFGQVANAGLVNSYLILGSTTLTLGATTTSLDGMVSITTSYLYSATISASGTITGSQIISSGTITAGTGTTL